MRCHETLLALKVVARLFVVYSEWLLGCCYAVNMVFLVSRTLLALKVVARQLLGYSGCLPGGCYAVTMVFLVSRTLRKHERGGMRHCWL